MTLRDTIELLANHPVWPLTFLILVPTTAVLAGLLGKGEGHLNPWKSLYSILMYLTCIPGAFAIALSAYFFLFERRSILDTDLYTQVLPVLSMVATIVISRKNVDLDLIPGFHKITGLIMVIFMTMVMMWFLDRTNIYIFSYMPIQQLLLVFIVLLLLVMWGWRRFTKK
jgi:hypothetical protein